MFSVSSNYSFEIYNYDKKLSKNTFFFFFFFLMTREIELGSRLEITRIELGSLVHLCISVDG